MIMIMQQTNAKLFLWKWFKNKSIILEQIIYIQNTE